MARELIQFNELKLNPHRLWGTQWLLLTSGDFVKGHFNTMTVAWGSLGTMWELPFAQIVVRPTRYTYEFLNRYQTFTLCAFPEERRSALALLGSKSGRDGDKIAEAGVTPIASTIVAAPGFAEAELIIECRKLYWQDMNPDHFLNPGIEARYPLKDYHRIFYGEVLAISGKP